MYFKNTRKTKKTCAKHYLILKTRAMPLYRYVT